MSNRGCSRWFFGGLIILLVIAGILGLAAWEFLVPYQGNPGGVFVELERGTTTKQLADRLQDEGVIRSRYAFLIWRALHPKTTLQAGEYFLISRSRRAMSSKKFTGAKFTLRNWRSPRAATCTISRRC